MLMGDSFNSKTMGVPSPVSSITKTACSNPLGSNITVGPRGLDSRR
jgi:hypothetical protein